jgi:outer membrane beta-barrel protein
LVEPIYNQITYGGYGTYHLDEIRGIHVMAMAWVPGLTDNGQRLKTGDANLDFSKAPGPSALTLVEYEYTAWYGKISLSKEKVMNTNLYGLAGVGQITYRDVSNVALSFGFGEKFYFGRNLSLRLDLTFLFHNAPDPLSVDQPTLNSATNSGVFRQRTYLSSFLTLGLMWLI